MEIVPDKFVCKFEDLVADFHQPLRFLDIGGGSVSRVARSGDRVTVLDTSPDVLEGRDDAIERLVGDAQTFDYGEREFDVALFWNVLEHVENPGMALQRAAAHVRAGGLMIVRGPELTSLKAMITRFTPHFVHVYFYRHVLGFPNAGKNGEPPCPVIHHSGASRQAIASRLLEAGFPTEYELCYVGDQVEELRRFSTLAYGLYQAAGYILRVLSSRRYGTSATDFILVGKRI